MLTPQEKNDKLKKALKLSADLYIKREDKHPSGSHKGRSLPLMIENHHKNGWNNFVISSSGNAAIAAARAIQEHNKKHSNKLNLAIFIGKKIDLEKKKIIQKLLNKHITLKQVVNPKQQAFLADKNGTAKNLRQSVDDTALVGYEELAKELANIKNLSAIFIPTSSGTTAEGLHKAFRDLRLNPQIHIVQTQSCHPLVDAITGKTEKTAKTASLASAIVDKVAHRAKTVVAAVKKSRGAGWIINNKEIREALNLYKKNNGRDIPSPNSILSLAGLIKAVKKKRPLNGAVVCLFTGK